MFYSHRYLSLTFLSCCSLLLLGAAGTAQAETKIGTVDMNRIFSEYSKAKEALATCSAAEAAVQKETEARTDVLKKQVEEIKTLTAEIEKEATEKEGVEKNPIDAKKKDLDDKLTKAHSLDKEIAEFKTTKQKKLQSDFLTARQGLIVEIMKVVNDQTKTRGFDIVFDKSGLTAAAIPIVLVSKPDVDMSTEVLAVLNKK